MKYKIGVFGSAAGGEIEMNMKKAEELGHALVKHDCVVINGACDAGIIISGRWGSMNEFTNLYDMGKVIGVLTGTGGIADELEYLMKKVTKKSKAVVIFDSSPDTLVEKIIKTLHKRP